MNSNTGASSGGHVGFKSGDEVYHFQFFPDERFLLVREPWDHFRLIYNRLRNRTIISAELPPEASDRIDHTLRDALLTQQMILQREQQLVTIQSLLEALLSARNRVRINGLGFFAEEHPESKSGVIIREAVQSLLGEGVLAQSLLTAKDNLAKALQALEQWRGTPEELFHLLDGLEGLIAKQVALEMLVTACSLSEGALLGTEQGVALSPDQVDGFRSYFKSNQKAIARLVGSTRADSGAALLLLLARCHALHVTITKKQLFTLDPFADNSRAKQVDLSHPDSVAFLQELAEFLRAKTHALVAQASQQSGVAGDLWYSLLESYNGKLDEIGSALSSGSPVRLASEQMVPSHGGMTMIPRVQVSPFLRANGRVYLSQARIAGAEVIREGYSYYLIRRNCVNELLRTVNRSFTDPAESDNVLGGYIDPVSDRVVIPHDFFYKVTSRYRTGAITVYPSRRSAGLQKLAETSVGVDLWLREGNTLSSSLYRPRSEDTPFLFFTDDLFWSRPILGLINLSWAALNSAGGIFLLPEDGGDTFVQGFRGMFYSVPELFFCNIRKGTYAYEDFSSRMNEL